jgi:glycosyltransferase involved in cell wall biosynthesis
MLIRNPEERYAKAGFPSKVVESLANSTPVLCNLSSDLGLYLRDGENAILASDHTPQAVALAMERAAGLSFEERKGMCEAAHNTAKVKFDYRQYQDALASLLK